MTIGNVRSKIKGVASTEPTREELIEILNTFSTLEGEDDWVLYPDNINNRQFVNFQ